jgi:nicotinate-nucleotide--dimethylbenzimidazole phosphoribosyltransferase
MELTDVLAARRTVRRFAADDIPDDVLARVLAAGLAMPHGGNTYAWRGVVLRHPRETHPRWEAIFDSVMRQEYLAEAPVLVVWTVLPRFWVEHYGGNLQRLVDLGLVEPDRAGTLLERMSTAPDPDLMLPVLIGEAMMAVGGVILAAIDAGLGTALSGCRPGDLATALDLPPEARIPPAGVLALGYAPDAPSGPRAPKPPLSEVFFDGAWDVGLG